MDSQQLTFDAPFMKPLESQIIIARSTFRRDMTFAIAGLHDTKNSMYFAPGFQIQICDLIVAR